MGSDSKPPDPSPASTPKQEHETSEQRYKLWEAGQEYEVTGMMKNGILIWDRAKEPHVHPRELARRMIYGLPGKAPAPDPAAGAAALPRPKG